MVVTVHLTEASIKSHAFQYTSFVRICDNDSEKAMDASRRPLAWHASMVYAMILGLTAAAHQSTDKLSALNSPCKALGGKQNSIQLAMAVSS